MSRSQPLHWKSDFCCWPAYEVWKKQLQSVEQLRNMHFKQTQVNMVSNSSHCFRHSSFMFTVSSESILMREGVYATFSSPLPTSHCAYKAVMYTNTWQSGSLFCSSVHRLKQVHCCTYNYVRKEWHFAADEVLQGSSTIAQTNSFGVYLSGRSVFKQSPMQ